MADPVLDPKRRDERALSMRIAGVPLHKIAQKFAWTEPEAQAAIERALVRVTVDRNPEGVAHQRNLTQQRLEALIEGLWDTATDSSDPVTQIGAAKVVLGVVDRQAALYGTNAPKETVITHAVDTSTIAATMERLFSARAGVVEAEVVGVLGAGPTTEIIEGEIAES